ncbi:MAG: porphobilinogen synthase [Candidatus Oxydemutatoraceae bacterium WSBS_2016_MAG_OTU14]
MKKPSYPTTRMRRMRTDSFSRKLMQETHLRASDLICPLFVLPKGHRVTPIESMPGISRMPIDALLSEAEELMKLGIEAVALFPVIETKDKSIHAQEAYNDEGLVPTCIQLLKKNFPELGIISDVALDPYTNHGQDGIVNAEGEVLNDETVAILCKQALSHAHAGADIVAPSDMMDGRIGAIRHALEQENFQNTRILSYSAKYASSFYGPFRDAVNSKTTLGKHGKESYQMDPANLREAIREAQLDVDEGADMLMVKPATLYLDVIHQLSSHFDVPLFAYHVSGEYAMLKAASQNGWIDEKPCVLETLLGIKRAGACAILTYYAKTAASWLRSNHA